MGLDLVREALPFNLRNEPRGFLLFAEEIFEAMERRNINCAAFKPNQGFYAVQGSQGYENLNRMIQYISHHFFETPVILDYKRGDIGPSSENYAKEAFFFGEIHAVTVSPYMGTDSVEPFLKNCLPLTEDDITKGEDHIRKIRFNKGVYILNRTSNKGAVDFQNLELKDGRFLYEAVAEKIIEWSKKYPGTGAVVEVISLEELRKLAKKYAPHNVPLLIPVEGKQGGSAKEVVAVLREVSYPLYLARINSSSRITHPWFAKKGEAPGNYGNICVNELQKLNEEIGPIF
jgi:orotidine-5'-phosphate decarboxylase